MSLLDLDQNATTPLLPAAGAAMLRILADANGNPASAHQAGRKARQALEDARETVARLLGALPAEVVFTSGATEANNLALFGLAGDAPGRIVANAIEHSCVIEPLNQLAVRGFIIERLAVSPLGLVILTDAMVNADTRLATMMLANHETGAIQPVGDLVRRLPGVPVHCDAAQAVGKIPVHFGDLGATALTLSAHKFQGPKGVGAMLLKAGTPLRPLLFGGHQQRGHRPGTEPVALAVGLATALEHAVAHMRETAARLIALRHDLLARLRQSCSPVVVNGPEPGAADSLPTTLNLSFPRCRADVLLMNLDLFGVACSTGSACSSGSLLPSPVLRAMAVPEGVLRSALRFSLGATTTAAEVAEAAERIGMCVERGRG